MIQAVGNLLRAAASAAATRTMCGGAWVLFDRADGGGEFDG
jgi:hypothetical protein